MSSTDTAIPHEEVSPIEGFLDHYVVLLSEDGPGLCLEESLEDAVTTPRDSSLTSSTLTGTESASTIQATLVPGRGRFREGSPVVAVRSEEKLTEDGAVDEKEILSTLPSWRKWALFACSCLLQFLLQLDMAAVAVTLPMIAKDLQASQVRVFTVATGYFLAQTVFQLIFSHISHAIGRKYVYLSGVALFLVGAIVAAKSSGSNMLIGGRVIQGIGAAGMFTMSAIVVVDIMQPRQRAAWTAISQASGALGNICGPLFVGLLVGKAGFTWRSIFFMELFFVGTLFLALTLLLPGWHRGTIHPLLELRECDWTGMLAFFTCSVATLIPINIGGTVQRWNSGTVIGLFALGAVSLAFLIYHQRYRTGRHNTSCSSSRSAFPGEVFSRTVTNAAFLGSAVSGMLLSMVFYNLVIFWEGVRHLGTIGVGRMLLSVTLTYTVSAALTGIAIRICGRVRWATITGSVLATLGLGLMQLLDEDTPVAGAVLICVCGSAGCGVFLPAIINAVIAGTEREWHSHAIAMRTLLYTAGQSIGISTGLAIFTNNFRYQNTKAHKVNGGGIQTPQDLMKMIKELPPGVVGLVAAALRWVWGVACVLALIAGIIACIPACPELPKDVKMDKSSADKESRDDVEKYVTGSSAVRVASDK